MFKSFSNHRAQNTTAGPRALNPPSLPSQWAAILEQPKPGDSLLTPASCVTSALPTHQPALWALPSKPIQHLPLSCKDVAPALSEPLSPMVWTSLPSLLPPTPPLLFPPTVGWAVPSHCPTAGSLPTSSSSLLKTHLPGEAFPDCPAYILNSPARQPPPPSLCSAWLFSVMLLSTTRHAACTVTRHLETVSPTSTGITAPGPRCLESGPTQSGLKSSCAMPRGISD